MSTSLINVQVQGAQSVNVLAQDSSGATALNTAIAAGVSLLGSTFQGAMEMGGMFTVVKVREGLAASDYRDPGWYQHPAGTTVRLIDS